MIGQVEYRAGAMSPADAAGRDDVSRPLSVLVVDDDPILRIVLRSLMESLGCVVEEADDGAAALRSLRETTGVVLLDLVMPVLGGVETCRSIRGGTTNPHVFVCVVSSSADPDSHRAAQEAGADEILRKPVSKEQLAAMIARVAARRAG